MTHKGNAVGLSVLMLAGTIGWAHAIEPVDQSYVRSLAAPGKTVMVMEYSDATGAVVERKGYASANGFNAISGTQFRVNANSMGLRRVTVTWSTRRRAIRGVAQTGP